MEKNLQNRAKPLTMESLRAAYLASGEHQLCWAFDQAQGADPAEVKRLILNLDDHGVEFTVLMVNFFQMAAGQASAEQAPALEVSDAQDSSLLLVTEAPKAKPHG